MKKYKVDSMWNCWSYSHFESFRLYVQDDVDFKGYVCPFLQIEQCIILGWQQNQADVFK
jgi:hypothetical protein